VDYHHLFAHVQVWLTASLITHRELIGFDSSSRNIKELPRRAEKRELFSHIGGHETYLLVADTAGNDV
jgi:hypothetical protein